MQGTVLANHRHEKRRSSKKNQTHQYGPGRSIFISRIIFANIGDDKPPVSLSHADAAHSIFRSGSPLACMLLIRQEYVISKDISSGIILRRSSYLHLHLFVGIRNTVLYCWVSFWMHAKNWQFRNIYIHSAQRQ